MLPRVQPGASPFHGAQGQVLETRFSQSQPSSSWGLWGPHAEGPSRGGLEMELAPVLHLQHSL